MENSNYFYNSKNVQYTLQFRNRSLISCISDTCTIVEMFRACCIQSNVWNSFAQERSMFHVDKRSISHMYVVTNMQWIPAVCGRSHCFMDDGGPLPISAKWRAYLRFALLPILQLVQVMQRLNILLLSTSTSVVKKQQKKRVEAQIFPVDRLYKRHCWCWHPPFLKTNKKKHYSIIYLSWQKDFALKWLWNI